MLLKHIEQRARATGQGELVLSASLTAIAFYEREGYRRGERMPHINGETLHMFKSLS